MATSSSDHGSPFRTARIEASVSMNDLLQYKARVQSSLLLAMRGGSETFTVTLGTHGVPIPLSFSIPTSHASPASSEGLHFTVDDAMSSLQYQPFEFLQDGRIVVKQLKMYTVTSRELVISVDNPAIRFLPLEPAAGAVEHGCDAIKGRPPRCPKVERDEEAVKAAREASTSRTGHLTKKEHPIRGWILRETALIDNGERPIRGTGDYAVRAPDRGYRLMTGRGTQLKWMFSVIDVLKNEAMEMYTSRSDFRNTASLAPLTKDEEATLEKAFQCTLDKWFDATEGWVNRWNAARDAGGAPAPVTKPQANENFYFHWECYPYAESSLARCARRPSPPTPAA
jgi:hypothetical protein